MSSEKLSIEQVIAKWLTSQPDWFSYALHVALQGEYTSAEVDALASSACAESGVELAIESEATLAKFQMSDLANVGLTHREIILESITATKGINAIAPGSELTLATNGLTVVYGNNGSGKSGFSRIIRNAATSRSGPETILSNVFSANEVPSASLRTTINGESLELSWQDGGSNYPSLPEIAFFDSTCASKEVSGKDNEVLYTPGIMEALARLSRLIAAVADRIQLASDQIKTEMDMRFVPAELQRNTVITGLLACKSEQDARSQTEAAILTPQDLMRLEELPRLIASDPSIEKPKLESRIAQLYEMRDRIAELYKCCQPDYNDKRKAALTELQRAEAAAVAARKLLSDSTRIDGVGSDAWKALWEAARAYSDTVAFPDETYPHSHEGALCPLCQQPMDAATINRMNAFESYMTGVAEKNLADRRAAASAIDKQFVETVSNLKRYQSGVSILETAASRSCVDLLLKRIADVAKMPEEAALLELSQLTLEAGKSVRTEITAFEAKLKIAVDSLQPGAVEKLKAEQANLKSRDWITNNAPMIISDAAKRERIESLASVKKTCNTRTISTLVTNVSQLEIVERMQSSFDDERRRLNASAQPVSIATRTRSGQQYQQITLDGTRTAATDVLSEGEQKIVALAGFFSVLDVMPGKSTAVLDDPITSLDHKWRKAAAVRIVQEAAERPVVVFTHEPVFCNELSDLAEQADVPIVYRTIDRRGSRTGIVIDGLDWEACNVNGRISALHGFLDDLRRRDKTGEFKTDSELSEEIYRGYSKLRSTWERAVEAVLLAGVVTRASKPVHTQQLKQLTDINEDDIRTVDLNMSRCSLFTEAHDNPLSTPDTPPSIDDLDKDISALAGWVKTVNKRRNKQRKH